MEISFGWWEFIEMGKEVWNTIRESENTRAAKQSELQLLRKVAS